MTEEELKIQNSEMATVGRIVHFYPGKGGKFGTDEKYLLPNSMDFAPAIVTQVCTPDHINLTVFVMPRSDQGFDHGHFNAWSITNKYTLSEESLNSEYLQGYWVYPPRN